MTQRSWLLARQSAAGMASKTVGKSPYVRALPFGHKRSHPFVVQHRPGPGCRSGSRMTITTGRGAGRAEHHIAVRIEWRLCRIMTRRSFTALPHRIGLSSESRCLQSKSADGTEQDADANRADEAETDRKPTKQPQSRRPVLSSHRSHRSSQQV